MKQKFPNLRRGLTALVLSLLLCAQALAAMPEYLVPGGSTAGIKAGEVLTVKQMEYVDAARVIGIPNILIIAKHVLPNVMTTVIVLSTMKVGGLILAEATLSFLGVGVPVTEPSLGMLVKNGFDVLFSGYWWIAVMPGLYIMLIVFGINLLGDFLRDEFNPKLK